MSVMSLREIQERLVEMGAVICRILEKHDVPYFITFGTLIGAVRHKGFIPWDDDFDIFLFDDSYECAIEVLKEELPEDMYLEYFDTEPLYFHAWPNVKDMKSIATCDRFPQDNIYAHKGIRVDMFVIHRKKEREAQLFRLQQNLEYQKRKHRSGLLTQEQLDEKIRELEEKIAAEQKKCDADPNERDALVILQDYRRFYPEEVLPLRKYTFEGHEFYGPNDYNAILSRIYGDYMQFPPENRRWHHYSHVERIDG